MLRHTEEFNDAYTLIHANKPHVFAGFTCYSHRRKIAKLVSHTRSETMLDYGAGKGWQYEEGGYRYDLIPDTVTPPKWVKGVSHVNRAFGILDEYINWYDPGLPADNPHSVLDRSIMYDCIICCDVMEHIPLQDVDKIIFDLLTMSEKFVFVAIACSPAKKRFITFDDNGNEIENEQNVHVTVKDDMWWRTRFVDMARWLGYKGVIHLECNYGKQSKREKRLVDHKFAFATHGKQEEIT